MMKADLKAELDELFEASAVSTRRAEVARNAEAEQQAAFVQGFEEKRADVIAPALSEFAEHIRARGWQVSVNQPDETAPEHDARGRVSTPGKQAAIELTFSRPGVHPRTGYALRELPQFSIICDKSKRDVYFHEKTMGPGHGGSSGSTGRAKLDELTPELVQQRAVAYFKKLMADSRPYDER